MKGRKPTPTHLKLMRGNPGKRPINESEAQPDRGADMPTWLSIDAQAHWPIVAKQLDDAGVLTTMDQTALGLYCEAFARWKNANDMVVKTGAVIKAPSGYPVQSPFVSVSNKAFEQMTKLLIEFGMTPSSRSRVTAKKKESENPFTKLIKGKSA
jgi:P27 family predicted phage terminase small subunit